MKQTLSDRRKSAVPDKNSSSAYKTRFLTASALIAALYVAVMIPIEAISFGPIQFRVSEMLCVLPYLTPSGIPGVTLGCFLGNLLLGAPLPDVVFGTLATFLGAIGTSLAARQRLPHARLLAVAPPILSNALIIPFVLRFAYGAEDLIPYMMLTVGMGEVLAVGVLGSILLRVLEPYRDILFRTRA